jgi:hypothetical protein
LGQTVEHLVGGAKKRRCHPPCCDGESRRLTRGAAEGPTDGRRSRTIRLLHPDDRGTDCTLGFRLDQVMIWPDVALAVVGVLGGQVGGKCAEMTVTTVVANPGVGCRSGGGGQWTHSVSRKVSLAKSYMDRSAHAPEWDCRLFYWTSKCVSHLGDIGGSSFCDRHPHKTIGVTIKTTGEDALILFSQKKNVLLIISNKSKKRKITAQ